MKRLLLFYFLSFGLVAIAQKGKLVGINELWESPDFQSKKVSKELRLFSCQFLSFESTHK